MHSLNPRSFIEDGDFFMINGAQGARFKVEPAKRYEAAAQWSQEE
jgi:hypothetical protein